ncbi:DoxX family membrane protein [soil metagenome]
MSEEYYVEPTKDTPARDAGLLFARIVAGGALVVAAYFKLRADPFVFEQSVESFKLIPKELAIPVAHFLPWLEAVIGISVVLGIWTRQSGLLAALTLTAFTAALASIILRHMHVDCGCFGGLFGESTVTWISIARNGVLVIAAVCCAAYGGGRVALTRDR